MTLSNTARTTLTTLALAAGAFVVVTTSIEPTSAQTQPDNTAANKSSGVTADSQKMTAADRDTAAKIRKAIMADKSLSTDANVKIICQEGVVTLKGPVRSADEAQSIVSKATEVIGTSYKVVNELSVKPSSK
jgi:osmotically-inducible protein OsmY